MTRTQRYVITVFGMILLNLPFYVLTKLNFDAETSFVFSVVFLTLVIAPYVTINNTKS